MNDIPLKRCKDCRKDKPATREFFHKQKMNEDGLTKLCKLCMKERNTYKAKKFRRYRVYQKYDSLKLALEHKERAESKLLGTYFGLDENDALSMCSRHNGIDKVCLVAVKEEL